MDSHRDDGLGLIQHEKPTEAGERPEASLSLYERLLEKLGGDPRVHLAGHIVMPRYGGGWVEGIDIIVAPVKPIYNPDDLNQFMDSLVPGMTPTSRDEASQHDKGSDFQLGKLYFDSDVGTTTREIEITTVASDPGALNRSEIVAGKHHKTETEVLRSRTWVRVYPNEEAAEAVFNYEKGAVEGTAEPTQSSDISYAKHWLTPGQLERLKQAERDPFNRLKKLLRSKQ